MRNKIFVVTGPSGVGKSYLASQLLSSYAGVIEEIKVYTDRKPRRGEEKNADRIFISTEEFLRLKDNDYFSVAEKFNDNWYGWSANDFNSTEKNLIVNIWPALTPRFLQMESVIIVALTVSPGQIELLRDRLTKRESSMELVQKRMPVIRQDIEDIKKLSPLISKHGNIFHIEDDETIPGKIMPWLESKLKT